MMREHTYLGLFSTSSIPTEDCDAMICFYNKLRCPFYYLHAILAVKSNQLSKNPRRWGAGNVTVRPHRFTTSVAGDIARHLGHATSPASMCTLRPALHPPQRTTRSYGPIGESSTST